MNFYICWQDNVIVKQKGNLSLSLSISIGINTQNLKKWRAAGYSKPSSGKELLLELAIQILKLVGPWPGLPGRNYPITRLPKGSLQKKLSLLVEFWHEGGGEGVGGYTNWH